ncbi:MAG: hypothetical protein PHX58_12225 [Desulfovibrio sp.]|jgi:hypothetical protein|nr:hypothetical protein [Desulfovibrio sp.]
MQQSRTVSLVVPGSELSLWLRPLGKGARIPCRVGVSVERLLQEQLGLPSDYIERRVRTVFINGRPVDDLSQSTVADGDELALAGALPGLVGICMTRNSPVAGFRQGITHQPRASAVAQGAVLLKLFNTVGQEVGPRVLEHGVLLPVDVVRALASCALERGHSPQSVHLREPQDQDCGEVASGATGLSLLAQLPGREPIFLQVATV